MSPIDFTSQFYCRLRLAEICVESGLVNEKGEPDARRVEALTGVHYNVVRRMLLGQTTGIDFANITRLSLGLRRSIADLFVIEPVEAVSEVAATNEKKPPTT